MPAPSQLVGHILGHYRILEQIGAGGMGVVYRAHDEQLQRDVGLKVLPAGTLADEAARKCFRKEALALAKLNHPNIATVHEFASQEGLDFLVTEYIPGATLDVGLGPGFLPEKQVVRLGLQLAEGLAAAHEHGVVHCDLKPSNLRVSPDSLRPDPRFQGLLRCVGLPHPKSTCGRSFSTTYTVAGFAEDLVWLCRQLAVEKPVIVGHSMGGNVALELAASYPDFAAAIVTAFSFRGSEEGG